MAATVNGQVITLTQYHKYLELKPAVQVIVNPSTLQSSANGIPQQPYNGQVIGSLGLQALTDLIQQTVLKQLAQDEKCWPSPQEIADELASRNKTNTNFVRELTNAGFTLDMINNDLALQLAQYKLTTQGINITDAEVDQYIKEHPTEFIVPVGIELVWMLVPDEKTKVAADAELKAGKDFLTVAQQYSVAPGTRDRSYRFQAQYVPQLAGFGPDLKPAIEKLIGTDPLKPVGEQKQTGWIRFTEGFAKFYINKVSPQRNLPIDDPLKKDVRRKLSLQRGSQGKDLNKRIQDKMQKSDIKIMIQSLQDPWKRSLETLKNSQTGAAGSPAQK